MKKQALLPLSLLPLLLFGCKKKDKEIYAKQTNTIYDFIEVEDGVKITGLGEKYTNQTDIKIPYSIDKKKVVEIDADAFKDVYRLESIDMSKSEVKTIGANAFNGCTSLANITFPQTLTTLSSGAFKGCNKLKTVDLKSYEITIIEDETFASCTSLSSLTLPDTLEEINKSFINGAINLVDLNLSNTSLKDINQEAFIGAVNLANITFPETLEKIGNKAFSDNLRIINLDLSKTKLSQIGKQAFSGCENLKNIKLPNTLAIIDEQAFLKCKKLEKLDLSNTLIKIIHDQTFKECSSLQSITLPNIDAIDDFAFAQSGLKSINLPKSVNAITDSAFYKCSNITEFKVDSLNTHYKADNGVLIEIITNKILYYPAAKASTSYIAPDVEKINDYAFYGAANLASVDLTNTFVKIIPEQAFAFCQNLEEILLPSCVEEIKIKAFFNCTSLKEFKAPNNLKSIGLDAFNGCSGLNNIDLSNLKLEVIGETAFQGCNIMNTLKLSKNLVTIERNAFSDCQFTDIYYQGTLEAYAELVKNSNLPKMSNSTTTIHTI